MIQKIIGVLVVLGMLLGAIGCIVAIVFGICEVSGVRGAGEIGLIIAEYSGVTLGVSLIFGMCWAVDEGCLG